MHVRHVKKVKGLRARKKMRSRKAREKMKVLQTCIKEN